MLSLSSDFFQCVHMQGRGFRRGSYKCVCKDGFYFPDTEAPKELRYFNGTDIETEFYKNISGKDNYYEKMICLPCGKGCTVCENGRSCMFEHNWVLRTTLLVIQCMVMVCLIPLMLFTIYFRDVKVSQSRNNFKTFLCGIYTLHL